MKILFAVILLIGSLSSFAACEVTDAEARAVDETMDHFIGGNVIKSIAVPFKRLAVESKDEFEIVQLHQVSYKNGKDDGILIVLTKLKKNCTIKSQVYSERSVINK